MKTLVIHIPKLLNEAQIYLDYCQGADDLIHRKLLDQVSRALLAQRAGCCVLELIVVWQTACSWSIPRHSASVAKWHRSRRPNCHCW
jgi:hypothetical protein